MPSPSKKSSQFFLSMVLGDVVLEHTGAFANEVFETVVQAENWDFNRNKTKEDQKSNDLPKEFEQVVAARSAPVCARVFLEHFFDGLCGLQQVIVRDALEEVVSHVT